MGKSTVDQTAVNGVHVDKGANTTAQLVLNIFFEYALNKFDDSQERMAEGAAKFLSVIDRFVLAGKTIEACLPAFPFKSANKVYKVLGSLPDKAEELALERLNTICKRIREIYPPGAKITIISDGITYNGIFPTLNRHIFLANSFIKICYPSLTAKHGPTERPCARWRSRKASPISNLPE
jgi:hypothetical protein